MRVLQLIDTLNAGGAERMAVNLANELQKMYGQSFLCATRSEGILKESIATKVKYLFLQRQKTIDLQAIKLLVGFVRKEKIEIIHAHSTSFFMACLVKLWCWKVKIVWHDHYGNSEFLQHRPKKTLKLASLMFSQIISVNSNLERWAKKELNCSEVKVLPNFIASNIGLKETTLKGEYGIKLVCLANLRPQKNHLFLIQVFESLVKEFPNTSLHLVGKDFNDDTSERIKKLIADLQLEQQVFLYGEKKDVGFILSQANIGVLGSKSEGLPLCVLEYGLAKLPVVSTDVGDIKKVINHEQNGLLVPSEHNELFCEKLVSLIQNENERLRLGNALFATVERNYSFSSIKKDINSIYTKVLHES